MKALSIRQPHAEAIMRGVKTIENRSRPTRVRGRIWIYAGLKRGSDAYEREWMERYGIDEHVDDLSRGVIVGSVELHDCDGGLWHLREPRRCEGELRKPDNHPQPVWFQPFIEDE